MPDEVQRRCRGLQPPAPPPLPQAQLTLPQIDIDPSVKLGKDFPVEELRREQPEEQPEGHPEGMECIKRTYQPSVRVRKRRHGYLSRWGCL